MKTNERIGSTISVKDPTHDTPLQTVYLSAVSENMQYIKELGIYKNSAKINLDAGNYVLELQFENDTNFWRTSLKNIHRLRIQVLVDHL